MSGDVGHTLTALSALLIRAYGEYLFHSYSLTVTRSVSFDRLNGKIFPDCPQARPEARLDDSGTECEIITCTEYFIGYEVLFYNILYNNIFHYVIIFAQY